MQFAFLGVEFGYLVHSEQGEAVRRRRSRGVTSRAEGASSLIFPALKPQGEQQA